MDLSIIVVHWNTPGLTLRCLGSVYATLEDIDFETIVIDNGSHDGSPAHLHAHFPQARLVTNPANLGFAAAANAGIRLSRGRFILLLNSDAILLPGAVSDLLFLLSAQPEIGICGPQLVYPDGRSQPSHGPLPTLLSELRSLAGLDQRPEALPHSPTGWVPAGWVSGACLLVRRSVLEAAGLLDERYFMFSEEVDLCARAHRAGWGVAFAPWARVVHLEAGSSGHTPERMLQLYRAKLAYTARYHGRAARAVLLGAMWLATHLKVHWYGLQAGLPRRQPFWQAVCAGLPGLVER